jgi:hypothetical protein
MDVWVRPTKENFNKLKIAFQKFGLSLFDMTEEKFLKTELYDVFSFGVPPVCIEILTKVKGLDFEECFKSAIFQKFDDVDINIIDLIDLIKSKKSVGRYKDLDDIENLEKPIP